MLLASEFDIIYIFLNVTIFIERSSRARRGGASSSGANQKRAGGGTRGEVCFQFHQFAQVQRMMQRKIYEIIHL